MNPLGYTDLYCERTGPEFWNEPFNALSNLGFPLAALLVLPLALARPRRDPLELALIALAALIGIGSFLFHTFAQGWAELADVVPIWSFVAAYVLAAIWRATGESPQRTARIGGIAAVVTGAVFWLTAEDRTTGAEVPDDIFNGSLQYLPALIALGAFAIITRLRGHPARNLVLAATLAFLAALAFRTLDLALCAATAGIGTHFLWHLGNAAMVGLLLLALLRHMPPEAQT